MTAAAAPSVDFPEKLQCLFQPSRFKVLHGGRGGAKSWGAARALLLRAAQQKTRVLCLRELQKSMEDSVHKLLCDQIELMGFPLGFWDIQKKGIYGPNGSSFSFEGIKNNATKVKSYEGIDVAWVEEAAKLSKSSFNVLTPTIRKDGSEIWLTLNADLETDYVYDRFVKNQDSRAIVVKISWRDNPWFSKELYADMLADKERDYDLYLNVWEGFPLRNLEGAIYAKELRRAEEDGRIGCVPWEPEYVVDTYWDLGRADNTAVWFKQRVAAQNRVLRYYEASDEHFSHFLKMLQEQPYVYGQHYLPHDGKAKQLGSRKTIQEQLLEKYPRAVHIVPKQSRTDGINAARVFMSTCWFDEENTCDGINALRNYRYRVINGQRSNDPLHDWASDGADAFRTMATALASCKPSAERVERLRRHATGLGGALQQLSSGVLGWMR